MHLQGYATKSNLLSDRSTDLSFDLTFSGGSQIARKMDLSNFEMLLQGDEERKKGKKRGEGMLRVCTRGRVVGYRMWRVVHEENGCA